MEPGFLDLLRSRAAEIHVRWEELLQLETLNGLCSDEGVFTQLIPFTIACVLLELARRALMSNPSPAPISSIGGHRPCAMFYRAGEQAFAETVVLLQAKRRRKGRLAREDLELVLASFRQIAATATEPPGRSRTNPDGRSYALYKN